MKSKELRLLLSRGSSRRLFLTVILGAAVTTALVIAHALLLATVIVGIINHKGGTTRALVLLAVMWVCRSVFISQFEMWCSIKAATIKRELRAEVTSNLDLVQSMSSAELSTTLIKGANSLDTYLGRFLPQMFVASVAPPAIIVVIFLVDPLSAVIAILTLPLIPVFGALIGKFTQDSVSRKWKSLGTLSRYFEDSLQGFVTLKIFGRHRTQGRRITEMGDQYTKETMAVLKISFLSAFVLELAATISVALIAVSIGLRLVDSKISFFHALVVLILAPEVYFPLRSAASLFHASVDGSEILSKIQELQNRFSAEVAQKERDFSATEKLSWERWTLTIPGVVESEIEAAEVHIGETVFIVGESGSGKSSFAENLLGQHFDADIRLDDRSLIPEHVDSYRSIVSWIPQLPHCAPGTIRDQFRVINPLITDSEIVDELLNVSLHLSDLPYGLDTLVGAREEKSSEISGGQLRKIAVARALLRNPRIIIADEPTADLDRESASAVMSALNVATSSGALLICITHDLDQVPRGSRVLHVVKAHP